MARFIVLQKGTTHSSFWGNSWLSYGVRSAQVFYKDVNDKTKGKKFYFSTYGVDRAVILATEYVTQMKN